MAVIKDAYFKLVGSVSFHGKTPSGRYHNFRQGEVKRIADPTDVKYFRRHPAFQETDPAGVPLSVGGIMEQLGQTETFRKRIYSGTAAVPGSAVNKSSGEPPAAEPGSYKCSVCGRKFGSARGLTQHIRQKHKEVK